MYARFKRYFNYVPLVKRLTRCPFTAEARVRIPYGIQHSGVEEMVSLAGLITQRPPVRVWPPLLNVPAKIVTDLVRDMFLQSQYLKLSSSSNGWANSQVVELVDAIIFYVRHTETKRTATHRRVNSQINHKI